MDGSISGRSGPGSIFLPLKFMKVENWRSANEHLSAYNKMVSKTIERVDYQ